MVTREQITHERLVALIRMIEEDGASQAGDAPPSEYLSALRQTEGIGQAPDVAEAHRNNGPPPGGGSG